MAARRDPDLDARFRAIVAGVRAEYGAHADEILGPDLLWAAGEYEAREERGDADQGDDGHHGPGVGGERLVGEEGDGVQLYESDHDGEDRVRREGVGEQWGLPGGQSETDPKVAVPASLERNAASALDACALRLVEACERALSRGAVEAEAAKRAHWRALYAALPSAPTPPHPGAWALCEGRYGREAERGDGGRDAWEAGDNATRAYVARQVERFTRQRKREESEV